MARYGVGLTGWPVLVHSARTAVAAVSLGAHGGVIPTAGNVLGGRYNPCDYAIIPGCCAISFLAASRRNGAWSASWRDCSEPLRAANVCIRYKRVHPGAALHIGALRSKRISIRGCNPDDCVVGAADGSCMAHRLPSVRRSVPRNWGSADLNGCVAGEGNHTIGKYVNSSSIP